MTTPALSSEKITEALKLLEEAARDKKVELSRLMSNKYAHLKDVVADAEHDIKESLVIAKKRAADALAKATDIGEKRAKELAEELDEHVHENPWPYIGGVALAALLIGYILGRK
ncbi:MAG: DUF883 domain-containing protein [Lentisphaerae bacterium]|nr:DUF883 domain-containing protein [Lentisphaerota bacterium]